MAKLSNINGKFAVEDTGAIRFSDQTGTTGQILKSNGNAAPTWVDPNTVGTGPWLPLAGGIVSGATTFQSSLTVGGTLTVNGSGGSVFNSTATTNHIIAAYRASNGNNVATFRTTDSGYIFRIHAQNAGTIYVQNDDGSNYIKIPDSGSNEVSGNTTFAGNVGIGITPNASSTVVDVLQLGKGMTIMGNVNDDRATMGANLYLDAATAFRYVMDGYAGRFSIEDGQMIWGVSAIGNAGDVATVETKMTLLNNGNLGIGATNPVKTLDVRGSLAISNSTASYWYMDRNDATGNFEILTDTNSSVFNIDTSGKVIINDNTIGDKLLLAGDNAGTARGLMFNCSTTTNQGDTWDIDAQSSTGIIKFSTTSTERMRINSGGNVNLLNATATNSKHYGITNAAGTTGWTFGNGVIANSHQFVIYDNTAGSARMLIDSSGNVTVNDGGFFLNKSDGAYMALKHNNSLKGYLGIANQVITGGSTGDIGLTATSNLVFGSGGTTERMRITSTGQLRLQGSSSSLAKSTTQTEWAYIPGNTPGASLMAQNPSGMSSASAGYHIVYGANNSSPYQAFIDVITYQCGSSTNVTVISSTTLNNSPGSRSYSKNSSAVFLNISGAANYNCNIKTTFINFPH